MQSYAIKPTATPILSAALWLRRPLGGRKASRTLPTSLPRRAPNWRELRRLGTGTFESLRPGRCPPGTVPSGSARWRSGSTNSAFREALETGSPAQRKALVKTLVAEIRVKGAEAFPFYRLPAAGVRSVGTLVVGGGLEPSTSWM